MCVQADACACVHVVCISKSKNAFEVCNPLARGASIVIMY